MRVLVINALSALRGGGQTYIVNFLENLPKGDFRTILIVNQKNKDLFQKFESSRIEIFEAKWASKSTLHRTIWEWLTLPSFLKKENARVYYAPGGIMITKMPEDIKSATALRNMLPFDEKERKRHSLRSKARYRLWLLRYVFLKSFRMADKVIFISEYSKAIVKNHILNIDEKSKTIPHGVNSKFLNSNQSYRLPEQLKKDQFYLYVSILNVYKAQKELITTWRMLVDKGFEYPLVLVGPKYDNGYGDEVLAMINDLNLTDNVFYLGKVDYEELPGLYGAAKILLFASSCECCPNILLEKMASGKPILCSNIDPMPEFGEDAVLYFDPYDPNSLKEQILKLESNPNQMSVLAEKAGKQALKYNWEKTVKDTVDFLFDNSLR